MTEERERCAIDFIEDRINDLNYELEEAYEALDELRKGNPTFWKGTGWDGDSRNQYGYECVESKIMDSIIELEEEIERWLH